MSLIDTNSPLSTKSELDLFQVPPTQVVVKRGYWDEIQPMNPVTDDGPYSFRIPPDLHFLQLSKNYVYMTLKIVKSDGTALTATDALVAPINAIGKTFFKQVKLLLGNRLVFDSGDQYAYRAFLETELNFGYDAKVTHLSNALYVQEYGATINTVTNSSFVSRSTRFSLSKEVEVMAPLHIDIFMQDHYLINNVELVLELHRNSNAFVLQCPVGCDYKLKVVDMHFCIRRVELLDSIGLAIEKTMLESTAKYPIRRVLTTTMHVASSLRATPHHTLFTGQLPRRIILGCVEGDDFRGSIKTTPFNFKNFSITNVKVISGSQTYPTHPWNLDFDKDLYLKAYTMLFDTLGLANDNKGNMITRDNYKGNLCLFAFDLTPDEDDGPHWDLVKDGATSIDITFGAALPSSGVVVIVYAEFDNLIMIDKNRNTFYDYTA